MSAKEFFSFLSGVVILVAFVPYILAIRREETKPAKASWIIWAILDTITLVGMIAKNSTNGLIIGAVTGVWVVVIFTLKHGTPGWSWLDKFCLAGAGLGIGLWWLFNDPNWGIVTSCSVIFLGSFPTFVSVWEDPGRENQLAWSLYWLSAVFSIVAIEQWTLEHAFQPFTFLLIESVTMSILLFKPRNKMNVEVTNI